MLNVNGLSRKAGELKSQLLLQHVAAHDVCVLLETRTDSMGLREFMALVPSHTAFDAPVTGRVGLPGQGVVILVRNCYVGYVSRWRESSAGAAYQAVWLRADGRLFGVPGQVMLGGVYVPPKTSERTEMAIGAAFADLFLRDLVEASQEASHMFVMGDFNALIGARPEPFESTAEPLTAYPRLALPRVTAPHATVNAAGKCLLEMVAACDCILTTGRERGDEGQATCRDSTRPDHVFMSPSLFRKLQRVNFLPMIEGSDHASLSVDLPPPAVQPWKYHRCDHRCHRPTVLSWVPERQQHIANYVTSRMEEWEQFHTAIQEPGPARLAAFLLTSIVDCAARDHTVAMTRQLPCPHRSPAPHRPPVDPGWYDDDCVAAREAYWAAAWNGAAKQQRADLHAAYKRLIRAKKRAHEREIADRFLEQLRRDPSKAIKGFTRRPSHHPSPISATAWHAHASSLFRGVGTAHPLEPDPAAEALAVERGLAFQPPSVAKMEELVLGALQHLDADSAAGLDGIPASFFKHAVHRGGMVRIGIMCLHSL